MGFKSLAYWIQLGMIFIDGEAGGDINAYKCSFYYLQWKQDTYGCMSMCDTDIDDLTINMGTSTSPSLTTIKRNDNKTPNKYIGITTAPNGDIIHPYESMRKKCLEFVYSLNNANINNTDADVAFRTIFIPRLNYQLQVSSLSKKELDSLQKVYESHTISKMGFNRSWPKELKYGSHNIGSLNFPNLYLEQTLSQIKIIRRMYQHEKHKFLIHNVLSTFQLQAGLAGDIFTSTQYVEYTDSVWVQSLVNAMHHFDIKICRPNPFKINHPRTNDHCIMNIATSKQLSKRVLRQINTCRQYLRVITISDITEQDGFTIIPHIINHIPVKSKYIWPSIIKPPPKTWKVWDSFLIDSFCQSKSLQTLQHKFRQGKWTLPHHDIHKRFPYYFVPSESVLLVDNGHSYNCHFTLRNSRFRFTSDSNIIESSDKIPQDATPITKAKLNEFYMNPSYIHKCISPTPSTTWENHIQELPPFYSHLISQHNIILDDIVLQLHQEHTTITICSDGSVYPTTSGGAWVIVINGKIAVIGINSDTGSQEFQNSYRSEAHSLLAGLIFLQELHKFYNIPNYSTRSICDNKGLIIRINNQRKITKNTSESDILQEIYATKKKTPPLSMCVVTKTKTQPLYQMMNT